jgi:hypothetical protein
VDVTRSRRRLFVAAIGSVLVASGALAATVPIASAVATDTVWQTDHPIWSVFGNERVTYRPPTYLIVGLAHPGAGGFVQAYVAQDPYAVATFYPGTGNTIVIGHTYTHVKWWADETRLATEPGASCADATSTVREVTADANDFTTVLAWDFRCGDGTAYSIRINSTTGYALLTDDPPYFDHAILPGQTLDAVYTIHSSGTSPLQITSMHFDESASPFSIVSETCTGGPVAPGGTCTATLRFAPATAQSLETAYHIIVTSNTVAGSWWRPIWAQADDPIHLSTSSIDLAASPATVPSSTGNVTVSFDGVGTATISSLSFTGTDAADFAVASEDCTTAPIASGGSCTIAVRDTPHKIGSVGAQLKIDGDAVVGARNVQVQGTGTDPVTMTPALVDLGVTRPESTVSGHVTLTSVANTVIPVLSAVMSPPQSDPELAITNNGCAAGIPAHGSCEVEVTLTTPQVIVPYRPWGFSGWLYVTDGIKGLRASQVYGVSALPDSGIAWVLRGTAQNYRWNFGNALGRGVVSGVTTLTQVASSNRVGSLVVKDAGPKMPVLVSRSTDTGLHWASAIRINPTTQHGIWPALAAGGKYVSAAWVSVPKVVSFSNTAARVLYVRSSSTSGSTWGTTYRLTSTTGRIDQPRIAMYGALVVVSYTDSVTGSVKVAISKDHGVTWRTVSVGSTTLAASWGRTGLVSVAVSGTTIGVSWISANTGTVKARISTNSGTTWSPTWTLLSAGSVDSPSVSIVSGRVGVAWSDGLGPELRIYAGGVWGPTIDPPAPFGQPASPYPYQYAYSPTLSLSGTTGIGVAWTECLSECDTFTATTMTDMMYSESSTSGATWSAPAFISSGSYGYGFRDDASINWASGTIRFVLANVYGYGSRLALYIGSSAGPAPAFAVPAARSPSSRTPSNLAPAMRRPPSGFFDAWGQRR